jgi:hypothetical protein
MTNPYRAMCAELLLFSEEAGEICMNESLWPKSDPTCTLQQRARALLAQPEPEGSIATEHARTQEINDLIAETVYGPEGSETPACANAWEVSKLIASLQTRVKALEALDD